AYDRIADKRIMNVTIRVGDTPRVYVERVDINGNTVTRDKVLRREFRVNEGDAFNSIKVKRSQDRIQSLGYFQENLEIKQTEGSGPDRVVLTADVEEKATGQLQFSGGYSSYEKFILSLSVQQNNFRGMGQSLGAGIDYSRYSKSVQLSFADPHLFDKQILFGGQIYRRDYNSFNFINGERNRTYGQVSTGAALRLGFPLSEYANIGLRYSLVLDDITLDEGTYFTDPDGEGPLGLVCDPLKAGSYLCDQIGSRVTSSLGYSLLFDNTNGVRATRGQRISRAQDFAGLGGDVRYFRSRFDGTKFWGTSGGWVLSAHGEGGYILPFSKAPREGVDPIRITDRFFGPTPSLRGFDIRGIGPRILRTPYDATGNLSEDDTGRISDALGGRAYYMARLELEIPTSASIRNLGLRPSAYVEAGSVFKLKRPVLRNVPGFCTSTDATKETEFTEVGQNCTDLGLDDTFTFTPGFKEEFVGNSASPRLSVGVGINWVSPFGPLRIDIARAILKQEGDDTKFFNFNVGTQF
nr:outer membrane protein assembly factor BamA [Sphingomonas sp.]